MIEASAYSGYDLAIGYCHLHGFGDFVQDKKKGYDIVNKYYKNNNDSSLAQCVVGNIYHYGLGVAKKFKKAFELYTKSAKDDFAKGQFNLGLICEKGEGATKDLKKA